MGNGLLHEMCKDATEELASGKQTWRAMPTNTLLLACLGMFAKNIKDNIARPLWFFASSIFIGVMGALANWFIGG